MTQRAESEDAAEPRPQLEDTGGFAKHPISIRSPCRYLFRRAIMIGLHRRVRAELQKHLNYVRALEGENQREVGTVFFYGSSVVDVGARLAK